MDTIPIYMPERFGARLRREFEKRCATNPRYSLRAFGLHLGVHHSTLSQVFCGKRRVPAANVRRWGRKLGISAAEISVYAAAEQLPGAEHAAREQRMRQWTAESMAVMADDLHWHILRLCGEAEFRADSGWMAERTGSTADRVNVALSRLLRLRLLSSASDGRWIGEASASAMSAAEFRVLALARIKEDLWQIR